MKFVEDLKPLKLYSSATKVFLPINEKNKRHGSVVSILANDKKAVVDAMTNPLFINQHYFNSYYADGDVTAIINHENAIDPNDGMIHEDAFYNQFKTPEQLYSYMKQHISYSKYNKLMSPKEVFESGKGSCHDQVIFELDVLKSMGIKAQAMFMIEYNENNPGTDAETHSFVYYKKDNKTYWFENAWGNMAGIHEYDSISAIKKYIKELHNTGKWGNNKRYPEIEFRSFSKSKIEFGMNLASFVDTVLESVMFKSAAVSDYPDISFDSGLYTHINIVNKVINGETIMELQRKLGNVVRIDNTVHVNIMDDMPAQDATTHHNIVVVRPIEYNEVKNGPYDLYLRHEVARMIVLNINPNANNYIATYVAMAISGQLEYFKTRIEKDDIYISGAIVIDQMLKTKGPAPVVAMIKKNDISAMSKYASKNWFGIINKLLQEDSKPKKALSSFTKKVYDESFTSFVDKYKDRYRFLSHIRTNTNTTTFVFMDDDNLVAVLNLEDKSGEKWVQALEITKDYQGLGLAKQIMKVAIKNGAKFLSVNKNNTIAIKVYRDVGFKAYKETDKQYFMKL